MPKLIKTITHDVLLVSAITYLVFFVLELSKAGLISNYFDLNLLLLWIIGWGIASLVIKNHITK